MSDRNAAEIIEMLEEIGYYEIAEGSALVHAMQDYSTSSNEIHAIEGSVVVYPSVLL